MSSVPKIVDSASCPPVRPHGLVLVVDDEEHNRTLLRDPLEARGYEVEEAENGIQALQKIARRHPDAILLDLMMPQMDGLEVCRHLRADPLTAHLAILMITALTERGDRLLAIQAGANDFLNKPIDTQDVMLRVKNAVHAGNLRSQLLAEQENSEQLLLNILPRPIADRMKKGETNIADLHANATVLVADLVGFNSLSSHIDSRQIVQLLNEIFSAFDVLVEEHGLETIKTVGDAYMAGGGISISRPDHAEAMVGLAISLQDEIEWFNHQYDVSIRLRIGISTGPVIAGVIGSKKFTYDVWGETVNLAWRLEATAEAGRIQISESTRERLQEKFQSERKRGTSHNPPADSPGYWLVMPDDSTKTSLNLIPSRNQRSRLATPV